MARKEKWIKLTIDDLYQVLAKDEIEKLNDLQTPEETSAIVQDALDSVASSFRGAFEGKGYTLDVRENYLPKSYKMHALALARYYVCTRFPNSKDVFLDEPRYKLYQDAKELLKDPYIGTPKPDYDGTELSADSSLSVLDDSAISVPFLKFDSPCGGFLFDLKKQV